MLLHLRSVKLHPHTFYSTLFEHTKRDEIFVVMSFAPEFDARWLNVIEPAINDDLGLVANRVDYNLSGESVVHDILDGIAHSQLILADITSTRMSDQNGNVWPQRNGNVMWEVGIAHVMRLPDEVLMVSSDSDPSIFDLTQFRAFEYDPSHVGDARKFIVRLVEDRLRSVDQAKSDYVRKCADALDPHSINYLMNGVPYDGQPFYIKLNMLNAMQATRLFELGILRAAHFDIKQMPETDTQTNRLDVKYSITPLGQAVARLLAQRFTKRTVPK